MDAQFAQESTVVTVRVDWRYSLGNKALIGGKPVQQRGELVNIRNPFKQGHI